MSTTRFFRTSEATAFAVQPSSVLSASQILSASKVLLASASSLTGLLLLSRP